jgi:hypothetical protein
MNSSTTPASRNWSMPEAAIKLSRRDPCFAVECPTCHAGVAAPCVSHPSGAISTYAHATRHKLYQSTIPQDAAPQTSTTRPHVEQRKPIRLMGKDAQMQVFGEYVYNIFDVADFFGVKITAVLQWIRQGELRAGRIGKNYWIRGSAINAMLIAREQLQADYAKIAAEKLAESRRANAIARARSRPGVAS